MERYSVYESKEPIDVSVPATSVSDILFDAHEVAYSRFEVRSIVARGFVRAPGYEPDNTHIYPPTHFLVVALYADMVMIYRGDSWLNDTEDIEEEE